MELTNSIMTPLRALATDCLPYELPLEMANHWLYDWLDERVVSVTPKGLKLTVNSNLDLLLLAMIGGVDFGSDRYPRAKSAFIKPLSDGWRAPASFRVRRDRERTRDLDLLAWRSQINLAFLYYMQKDVLLHYANRDRTSLRHPSRVNAYGKSVSSIFRTEKNPHVATVETGKRRLGTYNSYFVYEKYAFVGQFYDSREWHAVEARWRYLRRLDVANCFRSIYTHSVSWSTGTDFFSKQHIGQGSPKDMGNVFDRIMQGANWGETHGICVGPEASRVFAEIVFQHLGIEIEARVDKLGISRRKYEILRYVDDYFVFTADREILNAVSNVITQTLTEHKFAINASKTRDYSTPFTTVISVKKANLKLFLKSALPFDGPLPALDSREISVHLKSLLIDADNDSATVGASLSHVEKRLVKFIGERASKCGLKKDAEALSAYVWSFVHNILFQYLSHPSVATSMKVVRVLRMYFRSPESFNFSDGDISTLKFRANEYVYFAIQKAVERLAEVEDSEIEICHFLSLAGACGIQLEGASRVSDRLLEKLDQQPPRPKGNHASIFLLLSVMKHYLSDSECESKIRKTILERASKVSREILRRGYIPGEKVKRHAIQEIFVLAIATCPYLTIDEKFNLLKQSWLLDVIGDDLLVPESTEIAKGRFLRRCFKEASEICVVSGSKGTTVFDWSNGSFDTLLYEKQPEFIY